MKTTLGAFVLFTLALTSGCISGGFGVMDRIMSSWVGATTNEVIQQWGYPHEERVVVGRRLLVWNRNVQATFPSVATTTGTATRLGNTTTFNATTTVPSSSTSTWSCTRILEIDDRNAVIAWQWEGNNCPVMEAGSYSNWRRQEPAKK